MSEIVIAGNTSGSVTIAAPDVAGTTTLTLPTSSSTLATTADVAASTPAALSTASGSAPSYSARAWVNFNGTGTVAIRGSGGVSSITDNGTGNYIVNFTTAMPDANYSTATDGNIADSVPTNATRDIACFNYLVGSVQVSVSASTGTTRADFALCNVAVFR